MRLFSALLICSLLLSSSAFAGQTKVAPRTPPAEDAAKVAAKCKQEVQKRGVGERWRVRAELAGGREVRGYISKIDDTFFEVTNKKTCQATTILYTDVQNVRGPGVPKGAKIAIVVGVVAVVVVVVVAAAEVATLGGLH
jgi:hypothetical protein